MKFRTAGLILAAAVVIAAPTLADDGRPKRHKVAPQPPYSAAHNSDLFPGSVVSTGADNHYFVDTREPPPGSLGPGLLQWLQ